MQDSTAFNPPAFPLPPPPPPPSSSSASSSPPPPPSSSSSTVSSSSSYSSSSSSSSSSAHNQLSDELIVFSQVWSASPRQAFPMFSSLKTALDNAYNKMAGRGRARDAARQEFFESGDWQRIILVALGGDGSHTETRTEGGMTDADEEVNERELRTKLTRWKEDAGMRLLTAATSHVPCALWLAEQAAALRTLVALVPDVLRPDSFVSSRQSSLSALNLLTALASCEPHGRAIPAVREAGALAVAKPFLRLSTGMAGGSLAASDGTTADAGAAAAPDELPVNFGTELCTKADWQMSATLLTAYLVGASEVKQDQALLSDGGVIRAVLDGIVTTSAGNLEASQTTFLGAACRLATFLGAACRLAVIDANKVIIRESKALPVLVEMIKPTKTDHFLLLLGRLLLHLTFDPLSKQELTASTLVKKSKAVLKKKEAAQGTTGEDAKEVFKVYGDLLWTLGLSSPSSSPSSSSSSPPSEEDARNAHKEASSQDQDGREAKAAVGGLQVMLSYNWASQPRILRIAEGLKRRGFCVWLDLEQMAGSTIEAMAGAVEGSAVVVLAYEPKYKSLHLRSAGTSGN
eukprot:g43626.t1